jgi:hypothetical protein
VRLWSIWSYIVLVLKIKVSLLGPTWVNAKFIVELFKILSREVMKKILECLRA